MWVCVGVEVVCLASPSRPAMLTDTDGCGTLWCVFPRARAAQEDRTHTHTFSTTAALPEKDVAAIGCCNNQGASHDEYPVSGVAAASASGLPFTQLPLCKLDADTPDPVAFGTIAFFDPALTACPDGWTPVDEANGRVLVPGCAVLLRCVPRCMRCVAARALSVRVWGGAWRGAHWTRARTRSVSRLHPISILTPMSVCGFAVHLRGVCGVQVQGELAHPELRPSARKRRRQAARARVGPSRARGRARRRTRIERHACVQMGVPWLQLLSALYLVV